ncbi:MAG: bifunctional [glutamate--ammonia ligase]-adenylyl-L-tyrosine phosphorylase/[glutamate--ammonia-ligase] adenylyltransferase [Proteobacteria bacterium]|nr:bifunctional [glutamate--ammonia ligase]-adenylyl-L-tyrosine phosphorylase/[glutamate--ammonia-ligase] adenylyltransferase [Pseudomonadota bacterium]
MDNLPNALSTDACHKWEAFRAASKTLNIPIPEPPGFLTELKSVFAFSDFVARHCTRNPEILANLLKSTDLFKQYQPIAYRAKLEQALAGLAGGEDDTVLSNILRRTRLREMLRIAWRDLSGRADLFETMADLSALADTCIAQALSILYNRMCAEYGVPVGTGGSQQHLVVLAMGKLGGRELNFSSDIDLIFTYPQTGETQGRPKSISNEEFFVRLCRRLINVIGATTSDGIVFRVDMRLRPFGESGPIVISFDAIESYLQLHGREWERYAWIKARVVAGDKNSGNHLLERLKPFVYRKYLDFGVFESLRDMKQKISIEVKRKGMESDIKLGPGGIREIEFFGQIFQLIRGGVTPVLQERTILKVLKILARENYITQTVCDELTKAYEFLRNTEHRLQEFSDHQTHKLPVTDLGKERLAASLGFQTWESYADFLKRHRQTVHHHFNNLLQPQDPAEERSQDQKTENELKALGMGLLEAEAGLTLLSEIGFDKPDEVLRIIEHLRHDPATRALTSDGRNRLDKLMPLILRLTGTAEQPLPVLIRIIDLIKAIEQRTCYLALLLENPTALVHLLKLAATSPWIISFLARHPVLLDELLDPRTLYAPPQRQELESEVRKRLDQTLPNDLEQQIQELCIFKQTNMLRVASADVTGALSLMKTSDHLTDIAETVLNQVLDLAWNHLVNKHGKPECLLDKKRYDRGFAVIAYGKLGGIELGYDSDLDLVFLHAGTKGQTRSAIRPIDNPQFFARLGQRVIHILTARTQAGMLYETDMRLRPSGSSGILVSHIEAFGDYQLNKAWTWEHQALVRARPISGDAHLAKHFEHIRKRVLARPRIKNKLQEQVVSMRERMRKEHLHAEPGVFDLKQDAGGIVDIEFLVQYLVLLRSHEYSELLRWTDNVRILESLMETRILEDHTAHLLREAYLVYRQAVHRLSLQEKPSKVPADQFRDLRKNVKKIWRAFLGSFN